VSIALDQFGVNNLSSMHQRRDGGRAEKSEPCKASRPVYSARELCGQLVVVESASIGVDQEDRDSESNVTDPGDDERFQPA